jgi:plasmid stabilization system protein ParE
MPYLVSIAARAERDLLILYEEINAGESATARKWYQGLKNAILSLQQQPNRCPSTAENRKLRHLLYGHDPHVYRIIYRVVEKAGRVEVLHIRHGARRGFRRSDVR